eukprot:9468646-Pyramimonas_sp.AAC.1
MTSTNRSFLPQPMPWIPSAIARSASRKGSSLFVSRSPVLTSRFPLRKVPTAARDIKGPKGPMVATSTVVRNTGLVILHVILHDVRRILRDEPSTVGNTGPRAFKTADTGLKRFCRTASLGTGSGGASEKGKRNGRFPRMAPTKFSMRRAL